VQQITTLEAGETGHRWPQILPGGRGVLFEIDHDVINTLGSRGHVVAVVDLEKRTKRTLIESGGCPKYAYGGHVLFGRDGVIYAAPFDPDRLELRPPPAPVLEGVVMWSSPSISGLGGGVVAYDIARDGTLLFSPRETRIPERTLVSLDRKGAREALSPLQRAYCNQWFSPDGRRIAATVLTDVGATDAFVLDIRSGAWTRVSVEEQISRNAGSKRSYFVAGWMPDGERLVLAVAADPGMLLVAVDASESPEGFPFAIWWRGTSVSPDGRALLTSTQGAALNWDIWRLGLTGERAAEPWLTTPALENAPIFSPDGRWVAYDSNDSGRWEIYVRPYTGSPVKHQISSQGGEGSRWSRDGGEIVFLNKGSLWAARVRTSPVFIADPPQKLFDIPEDLIREPYDVSPDGQRFLMIQKDPLELRPLDLVIVPNWAEEMKSRLAAAK
jgi:serine/threonine-protein kinase